MTLAPIVWWSHTHRLFGERHNTSRGLWTSKGEDYASRGTHRGKKERDSLSSLDDLTGFSSLNERQTLTTDSDFSPGIEVCVCYVSECEGSLLCEREVAAGETEVPVTRAVVPCRRSTACERMSGKGSQEKERLANDKRHKCVCVLC